MHLNLFLENKREGHLYLVSRGDIKTALSKALPEGVWKAGAIIEDSLEVSLGSEQNPWINIFNIFWLLFGMFILFQNSAEF